MPHNNNNWKACNRHKRFPSSNLGHSYGMAVTLGYIMPDRRKVDEANKKVLNLLFGSFKDK